jgi:hypothetical protein
MSEQNIKYTTDGKKVIVLGNLNSTEKIVQEIFIIDGSEIPSGEHFVVKSLHDAPAMSWMEKRAKELEARCERIYSEHKKLEEEFYSKTKVIKAKLSFIEKLETNLSEDKLKQLIDFISGDIKYVVIEGYSSFDILDFNTAITKRFFGDYNGIRLLSVFGHSDGDLSYGINEYKSKDCDWVTIHPCKTMEEALDILRERFSIMVKERFSSDLLKVAKEYNLDIPDDIVKKYNKEKRESLLADIEKEKQQIQAYENELLKYQD